MRFVTTFCFSGLGKRQRESDKECFDQDVDHLAKPFKRLRIESKEIHQGHTQPQQPKKQTQNVSHSGCSHHQCHHPFCAQKSHRKTEMMTDEGTQEHLSRKNFPHFPGRKYFVVKRTNFQRKQTLADFLSSNSSSVPSSLACVPFSQKETPAQFFLLGAGLEFPLYVFLFFFFLAIL